MLQKIGSFLRKLGQVRACVFALGLAATCAFHSLADSGDLIPSLHDDPPWESPPSCFPKIETVGDRVYLSWGGQRKGRRVALPDWHLAEEKIREILAREKVYSPPGSPRRPRGHAKRAIWDAARAHYEKYSPAAERRRRAEDEVRARENREEWWRQQVDNLGQIAAPLARLNEFFVKTVFQTRAGNYDHETKVEAWNEARRRLEIEAETKRAEHPIAIAAFDAVHEDKHSGDGLNLLLIALQKAQQVIEVMRNFEAGLELVIEPPRSILRPTAAEIASAFEHSRYASYTAPKSPDAEAMLDETLDQIARGNMKLPEPFEAFILFHEGFLEKYGLPRTRAFYDLMESLESIFTLRPA